VLVIVFVTISVNDVSGHLIDFLDAAPKTETREISNAANSAFVRGTGPPVSPFLNWRGKRGSLRCIRSGGWTKRGRRCVIFFINALLGGGRINSRGSRRRIWNWRGKRRSLRCVRSRGGRELGSRCIIFFLGSHLGGGGVNTRGCSGDVQSRGWTRSGTRSAFFFPVRLLVGGERTGGEPGSVLAIVRVFAILVVVAR
jgi:hypothetical protein